MSAFNSSDSILIDAKKGICKIGESNYPMVGFGTYRLTGQKCTKALELAIRAGYRMIDTATYYENFKGIAKALKGKDRQLFYITSKVWHDKQSPDDLRKDLGVTLNQMEIDYLDAYLLHWPNSKIPIEETLGAMQELRQNHQIRHIGLSNVNANHVKRALEVGVPISWVQVEMHPFFCDKDLMDYCKKHSIGIQAWRPLDLGRIGEDNAIAQLGKKYGKTACQVALRWIVQHGCIPIPGSGNKDHIRENLDVMSFSLAPEEMQQIDQKAFLGTRYRLGKEHGLGFSDEFDYSYQECWPK